ncbi:MAG: tetratricopeptide repeat protein, partial [Alistipes sp.]|nr:tetratricopeptide repeat protein [Alistipes sp.]
AYIQSSMEQYSEAIKNYKKCIDISPSNSTAYNNLGQFHK